LRYLIALVSPPMSHVRLNTEVATINLTPEFRLACEGAVEAELQPLANVVEVAIIEYGKRHHITVPPGVAA
jgi:hypothetical protein